VSEIPEIYRPHRSRSAAISLVILALSFSPTLWFVHLFNEYRSLFSYLDSRGLDKAGAVFGRNPYLYFGIGLLSGLLALLVEYSHFPRQYGSSVPRQHLARGLPRAWLLFGGVNAAVAILSLLLGDVLLGLVFMGTLGPAAFLWLETHCRGRNEHACATCGYDLRATPDRCPECGAVPLAKVASAARRSPSSSPPSPAANDEQKGHESDSTTDTESVRKAL
jgi:hypothetical protein